MIVIFELEGERFKKYLPKISVGFGDWLEAGIKGETSKMNSWLVVSLYISLWCLTGNLAENIGIYYGEELKGSSCEGK